MAIYGPGSPPPMGSTRGGSGIRRVRLCPGLACTNPAPNHCAHASGGPSCSWECAMRRQSRTVANCHPAHQIQRAHARKCNCTHRTRTQPWRRGHARMQLHPCTPPQLKAAKPAISSLPPFYSTVQALTMGGAQASRSSSQPRRMRSHYGGASLRGVPYDNGADALRKESCSG
jgi:hypothetical protein